MVEVALHPVPEKDKMAITLMQQYPVLRHFVDTIQRSYAVVRSLLVEMGYEVGLSRPMHYLLLEGGQSLYLCATQFQLLLGLDSLIHSMLMTWQEKADEKALRITLLKLVGAVVADTRVYAMALCLSCREYEREVTPKRGISSLVSTVWLKKRECEICLSPLDAPFYSSVLYWLGVGVILRETTCKMPECLLCVMSDNRVGYWHLADRLTSLELELRAVTDESYSEGRLNLEKLRPVLCHRHWEQLARATRGIHG